MFLSRHNAAFLLASVALVCACESGDSTVGTRNVVALNAANSWVAIEPTQCLTNPWEADWLAHHGGDYDAYPRDYSTPGLEPEEVDIIKDYYRRQGVMVLAATTAPKYDMVCLACNCPEGHTLFLLVRESDVDTMLGFGYRVESP